MRDVVEKDFNAMQLEKALRQLGLPTFMDETTKERLVSKDPLTLNFEMKYDQMGEKKTVLIELYLHKYDQLGFHVPAGFKATLKDDPLKSHLFPTSDELQIRAKEAFNLLQGRAVNKAIWNAETHRFRNSWLRMDFAKENLENPYVMRELHLPRNTFPIGQMLRDYPIHVQRPEELFQIMQSLYAGSIQRIEAIDKDPHKVTYIEAQPEKQQLQLYNAQGQQRDVIKKNTELRKPRSSRKVWQELPPQRKSKGRRL